MAVCACVGHCEHKKCFYCVELEQLEDCTSRRLAHVERLNKDPAYRAERRSAAEERAREVGIWERNERYDLPGYLEQLKQSRIRRNQRRRLRRRHRKQIGRLNRRLAKKQARQNQPELVNGGLDGEHIEHIGDLYV